jgi:hypothetical protein
LSGVFLDLGGWSLLDGQSQSVSVSVGVSVGVRIRVRVREFLGVCWSTDLQLHDCKSRYSRGERLEARRVDLSWPAGWLGTARDCRKPKGETDVRARAVSQSIFGIFISAHGRPAGREVSTSNILRAGTLRYATYVLHY